MRMVVCAVKYEPVSLFPAQGGGYFLQESAEKPL
jgi:hypothetical protein